MSGMQACSTRMLKMDTGASSTLMLLILLIVDARYVVVNQPGDDVGKE